jgi:hypothetical protein
MNKELKIERGPKGLSKDKLHKIVEIENDIYAKTGMIIDIY